MRKVYDKKFLTERAIESRTILIANGADYPQYNLKQDIVDNIFIKEAIYRKCKIILSAPIQQAEGSINRVNLFKCY